MKTVLKVRIVVGLSQSQFEIQLMVLEYVVIILNALKNVGGLRNPRSAKRKNNNRREGFSTNF